MITLKEGSAQSIRSFLTEQRLTGGIRIELRFTGCCDPSLGLIVDTPRESDLLEKKEGLTFLMSPEVHDTAGEITIAYVDKGPQKGFSILSSKPMSEWQGFGLCQIERTTTPQEPEIGNLS